VVKRSGCVTQSLTYIQRLDLCFHDVHRTALPDNDISFFSGRVIASLLTAFPATLHLET
jgi:hypothetical protein